MNTLTKDPETNDRVRRNTASAANDAIDMEILKNIKAYKNKSTAEISARIEELEKEWSIERKIEVNASSLMLAGVAMGAFVNKKWLVLPGVVAAFLLQHAIQGWCPPVPIFRALKTRTRKEIDWEKFALKALRGDFNHISKGSAKKLLDVIKKA